MPVWKRIARRAVDDALSGDAAARAWLAKYLVGSGLNSLENIAAAELCGRRFDDGIAELAAEMGADHVE